MTFDEYQKQAMKTDTFKKPELDLMSDGFVNKVLGIVGETGEFADKIKKMRRNNGHGKLSPSEIELLEIELGDILWYLATVAKYLNLSFDDVAKKNIEKLSGRAERGTIKGFGDTR